MNSKSRLNGQGASLRRYFRHYSNELLPRTERT